MKQILPIIILAFLMFLSGCGTAGNVMNKAADNSNNAARPNSGNVNSNTTANVEPPKKNLEFPAPKPVENGKPQSYTGITITVPADWKALPKSDTGSGSSINFQSPGGESESVKLSVGRLYDLQDGDMIAYFVKLKKDDPASKIEMKEINGSLGILYLYENSYGADTLRWETFEPPDAKGYTVKRSIVFSGKPGTYERNKQQIIDILFSAKVE